MSFLIHHNDINTKIKNKHPGFPGCIYLKSHHVSKEVPLANHKWKYGMMRLPPRYGSCAKYGNIPVSGNVDL